MREGHAATYVAWARLLSETTHQFLGRGGAWVQVQQGSRAIAGRAHSNGQDGVGSQGIGQLGGAGKELKHEELSTFRRNPAFEMLRTQISTCTDSFLRRGQYLAYETSQPTVSQVLVSQCHITLV